MLQEFPLFRSMMAEAGARGVARGKAEGERAVLHRVLEGRFGAHSLDMQQVINTANTNSLTNLALAAGTESLEHLRARLGLARGEAS